MHKAIVSKIAKVESINGADKIQVAYVLGEKVIVQKSAQVGDMGVFFMPDLQLSDEFCRENNLFRDKEMNADQTKAGFFDRNRRVRAQPFMKIKSEGFFVPFDNFDYTGFDVNKFEEGFQFDNLNNREICKKFVSEKTQRAINSLTKTKKLKKVETPLFQQHVDTEQLKYYIDSIPVGAVLSFHSKLHGTSARYSHTLIRKDRDYSGVIGLIKKMCDKWKGVEPTTEHWGYVAGTRRVVLNEGDGEKDGYNGPEQWRLDWLDKLKPFMNKGLTVYGEIVGFANGKPIMGVHNTGSLKDKSFTKKYGETMVYKYGCNEAQNRFFIYRVTQSLPDGNSFDFTPSQVMKWASDRGFEHTFRVADDMVYNGDKETLLSLVEELTERNETLTEDITDPSHVSEGIIIRVDGEKMTPKFYKSKSYAFKVMEGIFKEDNVDTEDAS